MAIAREIEEAASFRTKKPHNHEKRVKRVAQSWRENENTVSKKSRTSKRDKKICSEIQSHADEDRWKKM